MIRLLLSQLRHTPTAFLGPFLTAFVTAVLVQLAAIFWWSVTAGSGRGAFEGSGQGTSAATFSTLGLFLLVFGVGLPAIIAFVSVGRDTVAQLRREYACWRLAGVAPRQILTAFVAQTILLVLPASALALVLSVSTSSVAVAFVMTLGSTRADVPVQISWQPIVLSLTAAIVFALIGGLGPGIRAARVRPIEALRDAAVAVGVKTVLRWILVAVLLATSITIGVNVVAAREGNGGASMLALVGILAALLAAAGPLIYPVVIRTWTLVLAPQRHPLLFLARRSSGADGTRTAATVTPVMIAGTLLSGYFSGAGTYRAATELLGLNYQINILQGLILFGPAATIGLVAGLMGIVTRSSPDARSAALLRTLGAGPRDLVTLAALETLITAITTLLATAAAVLLPTALYATGLRQRERLEVPMVFDLNAALLITALASIAVFLIRIAPLRSSTRSNVRVATM